MPRTSTHIDHTRSVHEQLQAILKDLSHDTGRKAVFRAYRTIFALAVKLYGADAFEILHGRANSLPLPLESTLAWAESALSQESPQDFRRHVEIFLGLLDDAANNPDAPLYVLEDAPPPWAPGPALGD